ncbi:MAG TPA: hypothetical protein VFT41_09860, partial [Gemmatimonadaceae bacterium]|nr:hypothetical protein [Gemmatimonadaceae bacterium]
MAGRGFTWKTAVGLTLVCLCAVFLWRVHKIRDASRIELSPRVAQLMRMRVLARWIEGYAAAYGRPAFAMDSVEAHLDTVDVRVVRDLRESVYGGPVRYGWDYCGFTLFVDTGIPRRRRANAIGGAAAAPA